MWNSWKVDGRVTEPDAFVRPWLDVPIMVVGYELMKLQQHVFWPRQVILNWTTSWFMIGSTIVPDAMVTLGPGESHKEKMWAAGTGQPWPSAQNAKPVAPLFDAGGKMYAAGGDLLDLHGVCFGGRSITVLLTIFYSPIDDPP